MSAAPIGHLEFAVDAERFAQEVYGHLSALLAQQVAKSGKKPCRAERLRAEMMATGSELYLRQPEAAMVAGISVTTFRNMVLSGDMPQPARVGGENRWSYQGLLEWIREGAADPRRMT